jgi:hypothetical protein
MGREAKGESRNTKSEKRKAKSEKRKAKSEKRGEKTYMNMFDVETPGPKAGPQDDRRKSEKKRCMAFDRKSPPFAKGAKDGAPSRSFG